MIRSCNIRIALFLLIILGGCSSTDDYWSFPVTRLAINNYRENVGLTEREWEDAVCYHLPFIIIGVAPFPLMADIVLLPITLPHDIVLLFFKSPFESKDERLKRKYGSSLSRPPPKYRREYVHEK